MALNSSFADLIRGIRASDQEAAHQFVRQFESVIRRQVRIHLTDPKLCRLFDSEDVCQMIFASFFIRAAAGQYDLERPEQLLKLLATMARNKVVSLARKHSAGLSQGLCLFLSLLIASKTKQAQADHGEGHGPQYPKLDRCPAQVHSH
jgi:DNA-directed RNA polymerase specialized sigma24 family protein